MAKFQVRYSATQVYEEEIELSDEDIEEWGGLDQVLMDYDFGSEVDPDYATVADYGDLYIDVDFVRVVD